MKKLLKITGIIVVLFILALIITPFFFKDKIAKLAKEEINKQVNAQVDFSDVSLSLFRNFPNFTFAIDDLSVVGIDDFQDDTLFFAEEFALTLDLGSVFSGDYMVEKILIDQPIINLLLLENEKANWDIAIEAETELEEGEEPISDIEEDGGAFHLVLKSFEIREAYILYDDKAANMLSEIRNFSLLLSGDMTSNNTNLNLETSIEQLIFKMDNIAYLNKAKITFDAIIQTDLDSSKYTFKENTLFINGLQLKFDGFVAMPDEDIYLDLTYNAPAADFKSFMSLIPAFYMEGFEDIKTEGNVAVKGWAKGWYGEYSMPAFDVNIDVENAKFQYPDLPKSVEDIQIKTRIYSPSTNMDEMLIDVSKFHFSMANNPMDITLKLRTPLSDPNIDANFKGKMNLASISQVYPLDEGMNLSGVFKTNLSLKGKQSSLDKGRYRDFKASGSMELKDMNYVDKDLPEGVVIHQALMNFNPRFIDLVNFNATYNKNTIELDGKMYNYLAYALGDGILKASFNLSADYLNFNDLMASSEVSESDTETNNENQQTTDEELMEAFDVPDDINFKLNCIFGRIRYDDLNIKAVFGKLLLGNKQIGLEDVKMELLGGNMEMNGYYNSSNIDSPDVSLILAMHHFSFKQTYKAMDMVQKLAPIMQYTEGNFSSIMSYKGKLDKHMEPDLNSINARGLLSTSRLTIKGAKSIEELANTLKINELKRISIDPTAIPYAIRDGKLIVKPFETMVNGMPFKADGVTYLNQDIDYNLNLIIPREKLGSEANTAINGLISQANSLGASISMSETINVDAKMTGTTTKPKVSLDFKQSKTEVQNIIQDEIDKQTEDIKNQVEDLKKQAEAEAERLKKEMEEKAKAELKKQQEELERKKKEEEERLRKKLEEEAKKKLGDWF